MIGQVKTINGVKQIVSVSGEEVIDSVTNGSMLPVTSNAVYDALQHVGGSAKLTISSTQSVTIISDTIIFVDTSGITLTLDYITDNGYKVEVYAIEDCTVTYYTSSSATSSLSMASGTSATFIDFDGWKYNGVYGAIWN